MPNQSKKLSNILEKFHPLVEPLESHQPHTLLITCADSRLRPEDMFGLGANEALTYRPIAALIPPYDPAANQRGLEALLCFGADIKQIQNILIMVHTDCGGAGLASLSRESEICNQTPVQVVRGFLKTSGLPLDTLREKFGQTTDPDKVAKLLGIQSLHNLMTYPTLEDRVRKGLMDMILTCYDMKDKSLSVFDLGNGTWRPAADVRDQDHFCLRKEACAGCSCTHRAEAAVRNEM